MTTWSHIKTVFFKGNCKNFQSEQKQYYSDMEEVQGDKDF